MLLIVLIVDLFKEWKDGGSDSVLDSLHSTRELDYLVDASNCGFDS